MHHHAQSCSGRPHITSDEFEIITEAQAYHHGPVGKEAELQQVPWIALLYIGRWLCMQLAMHIAALHDFRVWNTGTGNGMGTAYHAKHMLSHRTIL